MYEKGNDLQAEKDALEWKLHDLEVEHDRERVCLSNLEREIEMQKRQIDECLEKEVNLKEKAKRTYQSWA